MPLEIIPFVVYCRFMAEKILQGEAKMSIDFLKDKIKDDREAAKNMITLLQEHENEIASNAILFADYLFDADRVYLTLYCLQRYVESPQCGSIDFPLAANLFLL